MKKIASHILLFIIATQMATALENTTCKACHPKIYREYQHSIHARSSTYTDALHKAIWDRHPAKQKDNYKCAKCHTPSDHALITGKTTLNDNPIQQSEPISCQACHQIESIKKHAKANQNIYTTKKKYFFSADQKRKGEKVLFKEEHSFFGLFTKTSGSPYHDIDYSNKGFYTGDACMGCHAHKQNSLGFTICDLGVKQGESKETCISCHMPQAKGNLANQKSSGTHAFHGTSIHNSTPTHLSHSIDLKLTKQPKGFEIHIKNKATHALFVQPLRLGQLRIKIERHDKEIALPSVNFQRVIGKAGKPTMPWLADTVLKDTTLKAHEQRTVQFDTALQKGDTIQITLGYYIANPKIAAKLGIRDPKLSTFIPLASQRITIE